MKASKLSSRKLKVVTEECDLDTVEAIDRKFQQFLSEAQSDFI